MKYIYLFIFIFFIFYSGCEKNNINYFDEYQDKLVVNCIIDSRNDLQWVKVQSNVPRLNEPNDMKTIKGLTVKIIENNYATYTLRDTVIDGISNYTVFYSPNFTFKTGSFILMITSDIYPMAWASVNVPEKQKMNINYHVNTIGVSIPFNLTTKGYFYHLYLNYSAIQGGKTIFGRIEIPTSVGIINNMKDTIVIFPETVIEEQSTSGEIIIPNACIDYAKGQLNQKYGSENITLGSGWIILYSLDWNLYNYYHSVNGFSDPYSIRLDQPYWTNISGGYGVFGAVRGDSAEFNVR